MFMSIIVIVTLVLIFCLFLTIFRPGFKQPERKMVFYLFFEKTRTGVLQNAGLQ